MTKVGVVLPWIYGTCFYVFPSIGTSRVVNGKCLRFAVWPNKAMAKVKYFSLQNETLSEPLHNTKRDNCTYCIATIHLFYVEFEIIISYDCTAAVF